MIPGVASGGLVDHVGEAAIEGDQNTAFARCDREKSIVGSAHQLFFTSKGFAYFEISATRARCRESRRSDPASAWSLANSLRGRPSAMPRHSLRVRRLGAYRTTTPIAAASASWVCARPAHAPAF